MSTSTTAAKGRREFLCVRDDKSQVRLSVRHATKKELDASDLEFSAEFNRCLLAGLPTSQKMSRELRANEVWSPHDDAAVTQLVTDLKTTDAKIKASAENTPERKVAEIAAMAVRTALHNKQEEFRGLLAHTADYKAENAQRNFLMACVIERVDDGKRLWDSVEVLQDSEDNAVLNRCSYEYMVLQADMPSEWDQMMAEEEAKRAPKEPESKPADPLPAPAPEVKAEVKPAADATVPSIEQVAA